MRVATKSARQVSVQGSKSTGGGGAGLGSGGGGGGGEGRLIFETPWNESSPMACARRSPRPAQSDLPDVDEACAPVEEEGFDARTCARVRPEAAEARQRVVVHLGAHKRRPRTAVLAHAVLAVRARVVLLDGTLAKTKSALAALRRKLTHRRQERALRTQTRLGEGGSVAAGCC